MLIDFHTHIFPDKMALRTLKTLQAGIVRERGQDAAVQPIADGTLSGLRSSMERCGVDVSVVMPIVTRAGHSEKINAFAGSLLSGDVISFGGVHPLQENCLDELEELAEKGFKGVKLHPEFQQFYIDSPESVRLFRKAEELGLYVTTHSGRDVGVAPPVHCTPERLRNLMTEVSGANIIAAHLGGFEMWDDVEKYLVGTPLIMDISFVMHYIDIEQYGRIIREHGADKILFGSDSPWDSPAETLDCLNSLGLTCDELDMIKYKNAAGILGLRDAD